MAKPFIKWAGGKGQLLNQIEENLPKRFDDMRNVTYIEPFVGGGAMLFHMLEKHKNITRAIINDINPNLSIAYRTIQQHPLELIETLKDIEDKYLPLNDEDRKEFFYEMRKRFNLKNADNIENTAMLIFLNRTCFNGLYRENSKGGFNVPFGKYANPKICDIETITADSEILQGVEILNGDYSKVEEYINGENTFIYFDPPYRPLNATSSFNSYVKEPFNDDEQIRLCDFYKKMSDKGCLLMLSNSDCKAANPEDNFFEDLYGDFHIEHVFASRSVNANASKRGKLTELLIHNYELNTSNLYQVDLFEKADKVAEEIEIRY